MKKLFITANPSSTGFTHKICEKLSVLSREKWDEVEILDLYKTELRQDFLTYENKKEMAKDEITKKIQEKILWADELVFIFPIWWWDAPAIIKNFIDCNFSAGFAFRYENGRPVGLLKGKTARIITTSGGPSFLYKLILHIQWFWNINRISMCGMKQKSFTVFGNMDSSKTDKNKYLEGITKLV